MITAASFVSGETCTGEKVSIVGASGYIGKAVVRECVRRGYSTTAVVRNADKARSEPKIQGAALVEADVCDTSSLATCPAFEKGNIDVLISCLASRSGKPLVLETLHFCWEADDIFCFVPTGTKSDSYAIDYQATLNCVEAARTAGARHVVLLSAFCVKSAEMQDPDALQFQYAKMKLEGALAAQSDLTWTSVRPTAFFKSVSGQLEVVQSGAPFVYFDLGGGRSAKCNPISEADLASALIDTIADPSKTNQIWNVGGPDEGMSMETQGEMLAGVLGKEPKLLAVPIGQIDVIIGGLQGAANFFKGIDISAGLGASLDDAAELGRIGKYYAVVDMLTTDPAERYGSTSLSEHYKKIAVEGQEYDPYTTMFSSSAKKES